MLNKLAGFMKEEKGATAIEYALMASLIAGVIVATVGALGGNVSNLFTKMANAFP